MKSWLMGLLLFFLSPLCLLAETGFIYKGDLNGDGVEDQIQSGPTELFGQAGGPCVVTVSVSAREFKKGIVSCSPSGFFLEQSKYTLWPARYWSYTRHALGEGSYTATTLDGQFTAQSITLYNISTEQALGYALLNTIKSHTQHITFTPIMNYTPPESPCGQEWGKGC